MPAEYECGKIAVDGIELPLKGDATVTVAIPGAGGDTWRVEAWISTVGVPVELRTLSERGDQVRVVCTDVYMRPQDRTPARRISGETNVHLEAADNGDVYIRLEGEDTPLLER